MRFTKEAEVEIDGSPYLFRAEVEEAPAQNGGQWEPSWPAHLELVSGIEIELFGRWFAVGGAYMEDASNLAENMVVFRPEIYDQIMNAIGRMEAINETAD